jgi:hypothetical protein
MMPGFLRTFQTYCSPNPPVCCEISGTGNSPQGCLLQTKKGQNGEGIFTSNPATRAGKVPYSNGHSFWC